MSWLGQRLLWRLRFRGLGGRTLRLSSQEVRNLGEHDFDDPTQLWQGVGRNYATGLTDVSAAAGGTPDADKLRDLLAATAQRQAQNTHASVWRFVPDLLFAIALLVGGWSYIRVLATQIAPASEMVVVAGSSEIPGFSVLTDHALSTNTVPRDSEAIAPPVTSLVGRVTLRAVPAGAAVHERDLAATCPAGIPTASASSGSAGQSSSSSGQMEVLSLPVRSAVLSGLRPNDCVSLVFSARPEASGLGNGFMLPNAVVLQTSTSGDAGTLVIAASLTEADRTALGAALAQSDVFVLRP
jgi:hypothetical protein